MRIEDFLEKAWDGYSRITPDAEKIHRLLEDRGERIINDHVAFRTFNIPGLGRLELGRIFEDWGFQKRDDLDFPAKKLKATYWQHERPDLPKIFVSELLLEQFDQNLQNWIRSLVEKTAHPARRLKPESLLEPAWDPIRFDDYERFYPISEYAAWTAAFGIRVNHFTVFVNELSTFKDLIELNRFLLDSGFTLNQAGGAVKGTRAQGLEQSSTQARKIPWRFAGGVTREVMSCYYEFALRHRAGSGDGLFHGFIPESADKIFESNFEKK